MLNLPMLESGKKDTFHKTIMYAAATTMAITMVLLAGPFTASNASQEDSGRKEIPLALVNGMPILPSDLNYAVEAWNFSTRQGTDYDYSGTLDQLIVIELLYQESLKYRFHGLVGDAESIYRREVARAGSEEKLRSTLQCNNISLQQFRQYIFRNLAINRLLDIMVYSRITVSDDEISEFYEENLNSFKTPESVRLRQIFIKIPHTADEKTISEVEERAREVFKQAISGRDFVMLAKKYSDDPSAAGIGGEISVIYRDNLHRELDSLVFSRVEGSVTEPIRSRGGYRIFQVVSSSPPAIKPLDEVRSRIITQIRRSKALTMISDYIVFLKENADIRILTGEVGEKK